MKEIEQTCFIELEDEPFIIEVILYKDGTSERKVFDEGGATNITKNYICYYIIFYIM